jgi:hypothetical protein
LKSFEEFWQEVQQDNDKCQVRNVFSMKQSTDLFFFQLYIDRAKVRCQYLSTPFVSQHDTGFEIASVTTLAHFARGEGTHTWTRVREDWEENW